MRPILSMAAKTKWDSECPARKIFAPFTNPHDFFFLWLIWKEQTSIFHLSSRYHTFSTKRPYTHFHFNGTPILVELSKYIEANTCEWNFARNLKFTASSTILLVYLSMCVCPLPKKGDNITLMCACFKQALTRTNGEVVNEWRPWIESRIPVHAYWVFPRTKVFPSCWCQHVHLIQSSGKFI